MKRTIICGSRSIRIIASSGSSLAWLHVDDLGSSCNFAADTKALDKIITALQEAKAALPVSAEQPACSQDTRAGPLFL